MSSQPNAVGTTLTDGRRVGVFRGIHGHFFAIRDDLVTKQIQRYGAHTRPEIAFVRSAIKAGDVVVDVGAHIGTFAIPMAYSVGFEGRVLAFEPNAECFNLLQLNVALNGLQQIVTPYDTAIGDQSRVYRIVRNDEGNSGASFLEQHGELDLDSLEQRAVAESVDARPEVGLVSRRLDEMLEDLDLVTSGVDLLKIDVEGMEELVLRGASRTLERCRPLVYMEVGAEQSRRQGLSATGSVEVLRDLDYQFFVNVGERNVRNDDFDVRPLLWPDLLSRISDQALFDMLAVPSDSELVMRYA